MSDLAFAAMYVITVGGAMVAALTVAEFVAHLIDKHKGNQ